MKENFKTQKDKICNAKSYNNLVGDDIWFIIDSATETLRKINFSEFSVHQREWIQKLILTQNPYSDGLKNFYYTFSTFKAFVDGIKALARYMKGLTPKKQQLRNWKLVDIKNLISSELIKDDQLKSVTYIRRLLNAINASYLSRYTLDGIHIPLPENLMVKTITPILNKFDILYSEWERGGQRDSLPISVGTLMLADAINLIRSEKVKILKLYFGFIRQGKLTKALALGKKGILNVSLDEFVNCGFTGELLTKPKHYVLRNNFVTELKNISTEHTEKFPFNSQKEINNFVDEIWGACIAILLSVTAIRIIELKTLKSHWYKAIKFLDVNGDQRIDATFDSKNIKTGSGILAKKGLSPLGLEVIDLINELSYVDKKKLKLDLFSPSHKSPWLDCKIKANTRTGVSVSFLTRLLKRYYSNFLSRVHESASIEFPDLSAHQLRHYKMVFALRKFDGNVEECIREEFRHHDHHTRSYSHNRLNEGEVREVETEFINEIVQRILTGDESDKWIGSTVKKIKRLSRKLLAEQSIELLPLTELVEHIENIRNDIHSITFHSYGVCIVLKENISKAKCGVRDNIVQVGQANSSSCYFCVNYGASRKSHEENLKLNKARWQEVSENQLIANFQFVEEAKLIVRKLNEIQKDMGTDK